MYVPGGGIPMGMPGGPLGGIIIGAGIGMPPINAAEGPPTPRTGPDGQKAGEGRGKGNGGIRDVGKGKKM